MRISWFYDIAILVILAVCFYFGSRKGLLKMVLILVGYAVSVLGSYYIATALKEPVYDKLLKTKLEQSVYESTSEINVKAELKKQLEEKGLGNSLSDEELDSIINTTGDKNEKLVNILKQKNSAINVNDIKAKTSGIFDESNTLKYIQSKIPEKLYNQLNAYITKTDGASAKLITSMNNPDENERAHDVTDIAIKPIAVSLLGYLIFIISFIIISIVVRIIIKIICKAIDYIPIVNGANKFFGGIIGLAEGALIVLVIAMLLRLIISTSKGDMLFFNNQIIENTKLFKLIYNINFF